MNTNFIVEKLQTESWSRTKDLFEGDDLDMITDKIITLLPIETPLSLSENMAFQIMNKLIKGDSW